MYCITAVFYEEFIIALSIITKTKWILWRGGPSVLMYICVLIQLSTRTDKTSARCSCVCVSGTMCVSGDYFWQQTLVPEKKIVFFLFKTAGTAVTHIWTWMHHRLWNIDGGTIFSVFFCAICWPVQVFSVQHCMCVHGKITSTEIYWNKKSKIFFFFELQAVALQAIKSVWKNWWVDLWHNTSNRLLIYEQYIHYRGYSQFVFLYLLVFIIIIKCDVHKYCVATCMVWYNCLLYIQYTNLDYLE